jgi:uncharacterized coiled-coil protein SlyX
MEHQEQDMDSLSKGRGEVTGSFKSDDRLTIMIFKGAGKVRTVKISPRFLLGVSLFLLLYIVATIFLTNAFFSASRTTKIQERTIATLTGELAKKREALEKSRQHSALLEEYLKDEKEQTFEPMSMVDYTESSFPKAVEINDLTVKRNHSELQVDFKIINTQPNEEPIGGYIFMLARVKDSEKSEVWVYPNAMLRNGRPVDYRLGHRFFIQRFKSITGNYTLSKKIDDPIILEILVYDRNGGLILKKVAEV